MHRLRRTAAVTAAALAFLAVPAAAQAQDPVQYAALGDSYSSGTGTGDYYENECLLSELAYPHLLAEELGAELAFAACSGATTQDLLANQLGALSEDTDLVTVTIGGNDIGWSDAITACITPLNDCMDDIEAAEAKAQNELPGLLDGVYNAIADGAPKAEIQVLGYPRLFNGEDTCDAFGQISIAEQQRMNQAADLLSEVIEGAATGHDFNYVDVRPNFEDHAVCDDVEYLHGLRYPTVESYHPNALGHSDGYFPALLAAL
jgi:lysophospholipase L1-like esterase